jgi:hypothetical protein
MEIWFPILIIQLIIALLFTQDKLRHKKLIQRICLWRIADESKERILGGITSVQMFWLA